MYAQTVKFLRNGHLWSSGDRPNTREHAYRMIENNVLMSDIENVKTSSGWKSSFWPLKSAKRHFISQTPSSIFISLLIWNKSSCLLEKGSQTKVLFPEHITVYSHIRVCGNMP